MNFIDRGILEANLLEPVLCFQNNDTNIEKWRAVPTSALWGARQPPLRSVNFRNFGSTIPVHTQVLFSLLIMFAFPMPAVLALEAASDLNGNRSAGIREFSSGLSQISMDLSGSLCPACLQQLRKVLITNPGVVKLEFAELDVQRQRHKHNRKYKQRKILLKIVFANEKISSAELIQSIRNRDFKVSKISISRLY